MMQSDVGKAGLIISKVQHKRANTNVLSQIRESQKDGMMGETFRLFLENWHEQVLLTHLCINVCSMGSKHRNYKSAHGST